jgi:16S rRNA (guanine527-N7)-methyltransferase
VNGSLKREAQAKLTQWGVTVEEPAWDLVDNYLRDVLEYNRKTNLTAAKTYEELLRRHLLDSWAAIAPLEQCAGSTLSLCDVGTGGGFIGMGLKIARPQWDVTLVESLYRKFVFLNAAAAKTRLTGLSAIQGRAGKDFSGSFDVVVSRALAPLPDALRLQLPLTKPGGWTFVYQSECPDPTEKETAKAAADCGGTFEDARSYRLPGEDKDRWFAVLRRIA